MGVTTKKVDRINRETLSEVYEGSSDNLNESPKDEHRVFMFFSVDLANSTKFKSRHPKYGVPVLVDFYEVIYKYICKEHSENGTSVGVPRVWKYVGDEVLFYLEVTDMMQILLAPHLLHSAMIQAQAEFYETNPVGKHFLYFQGALWIAAATTDTSINDKQDNAPPNAYGELSKSTARGLDFVGVDIDEGFRIAKNTAQGKIALDPKIAFFLNEYESKWEDFTYNSLDDKVKIVNYVKMKGIWDERLFPVIWYADVWKPEKLFLYDEEFTNPNAKAYISNDNSKQKISNIKKIFDDLGFPMKSIEIIEGILQNKKPPSSSLGREERLTELHCAVVCINSQNQAFIVKRSNDRSRPGVWEFGCTFLYQNDSYTNKIVIDYKEQFNLDIELIVDSESNNPIPINVYEIDDNPGIKKGIVFVARVVNDATDITLGHGKYETHKFITVDEVCNFEKNSVSDFSSSINRAFREIKAL